MRATDPKVVSPLDHSLTSFRKYIAPFLHLAKQPLDTFKFQRRHHSKPETAWYDMLVHLFGKYKAPVWFKAYVKEFARYPNGNTAMRYFISGELIAYKGEDKVAPFYWAYGIYVMSGASVYRELVKTEQVIPFTGVRGYERLTRKELHELAYLTINPEEQSPITMAIALAENVPLDMASKLARTNIGRWPVPAIRMIAKYFVDAGIEKQKQLERKLAEKQILAQLKAEYEAEGLIYVNPLPRKRKDRFIECKADLTIVQLNHIFDYLSLGVDRLNSRCSYDATEAQLADKLKAWSHILKKSAQSLQDEAARWTRTLHKESAAKHHVWTGFDFPTIDIHGAPEEQHYYQFFELITGSELASEGSMLRHCVASYYSMCQRGDCTIISLRRMNPFKALVTIEVRPVGKRFHIVQAAGVCNRKINDVERDLIKTYINELAQYDIDLRYKE